MSSSDAPSQALIEGAGVLEALSNALMGIYAGGQIAELQALSDTLIGADRREVCASDALSSAVLAGSGLISAGAAASACVKVVEFDDFSPLAGAVQLPPETLHELYTALSDAHIAALRAGGGELQRAPACFIDSLIDSLIAAINELTGAHIEALRSVKTTR